LVNFACEAPTRSAHARYPATPSHVPRDPEDRDAGPRRRVV